MKYSHLSFEMREQMTKNPLAEFDQPNVAAEFFAGIGLMRAGLEKAGWKVGFANDIDPVKRRLYLFNFRNSESHFTLDDIHNLSPDMIPDSKLATASFPCTDLSLAGRREGLGGPQSSAFWGFVELVQGLGERRPELILLENVAGFLTSAGGEDFRKALSALNELGYWCDAFLVNASNFVPQSRLRLFVVAGLSHKQASRTSAETATESEIRPAKLIEFIRTNPEINWSINTSLPPLPKLTKRLVDIVEMVSDDSPLWFSEERVLYLLNQTFDRHLQKILDQKRNENIEFFTAFRRVRNGKSMAEIRFDGIAGCLRTPKGGSARQIVLQVGKGEIKVRLMTPLECARLMGADDFLIAGSQTEALFGFGDAVCVPVVSWIAENYLNKMVELTENSPENKVKKYVAT